MSTRQSTDAPTVPTVSVVAEDGRRYVCVTRNGVRIRVAERASSRADALAAYLRGALADAYAAGRADAERERTPDAEPERHAVEVVRYDHGESETRRYRALCECGWNGCIAGHYKTAEADGTDHLRDPYA